MTTDRQTTPARPATEAGRALHKAEMFDLTIEEDRRRLALAIEAEARSIPVAELDVERLARAMNEQHRVLMPDTKVIGPELLNEMARDLRDRYARLASPVVRTEGQTHE